MTDHLTIPVPAVAPLGLPVDKPEFVHEVWDAFVANDPANKAQLSQPAEMRVLMAILRAVHEGLHAVSPCTICTPDFFIP